MPRYRYDDAQTWMLEKIDELVREGNAAYLSYFVRTLILQTDSDTIQDLYQREMDADGYFEDLDTPPEGYRVEHDVEGWYVVEPDEEEPEDGESLGFDGRPHYGDKMEAVQKAREAAGTYVL